jgi:hypothetical protein
VRPPDLAGIRARVLLIRGRYDRMVPFEVSIAILNHIADSRLVLYSSIFRKFSSSSLAALCLARWADRGKSG